MDEEVVGVIDNIVIEFVIYEDFFDSQIILLDLYYFEVIFFLFICFFELNLFGINSELSLMFKLQFSWVY